MPFRAPRRPPGLPAAPAPVLWITPQPFPDAAQPSPCGADAGGCQDAPVCAAGFEAPRCPDPVLVGDASALARVVQALREVGDLARGHNIVDAGHIRALRIGADEAELALSFQARCGIHQHIAEAAFGVLRRELPGRDLYVTHPR